MNLYGRNLATVRVYCMRFRRLRKTLGNIDGICIAEIDRFPFASASDRLACPAGGPVEYRNYADATD